MAGASSSKHHPDNTGHSGDHLQAPTTSLLSPASSSRPRSILNVSRSAALTPSLSSNTPLHQLSSSPSSASFVSNQATRGGGGLGSTTQGALSRLKRVASSASIASSSKFQQQQPSIIQPVAEATTSSLAEEDIGEAGHSRTTKLKADVDEKGLKPPAALVENTKSNTLVSLQLVNSQRKGSEASVNTMTKRPRSPPLNVGDSAALKQARRRTWFGFGGYVDTDGDTQMADDDQEGKGKNRDKEDDVETAKTSEQQIASAVEAEQGDTQMQDAEPKKIPIGVADGQAIDSNGWLTWRAPTALNDIQSASPAQPATYTDTVKRYISATSSQGASWIGWPGWSAEQRDSTLIVPVDARKTEEEPVADVEVTANDSNSKNDEQPAKKSGWWPLWGSQQVQPVSEVKSTSPPTPAEQVKAEALARLDAKDAVLNNATRSTWINYFSSRSALPPSRIEDQDRGPEVMKIDFPSSRVTDADQKAAEKERTTKIAKEEATKKPAPSVNKDGQKKGEKINPKADPAPPISRPSTPLTTDKEKAKEVTKAAATKAAPKGKKGDGKPIKVPPPPNLLLPSFEDTFNTAPRSMPPSKGVLEKTLSYFFNRSGEDSSRNKMRKPSLLSIGSSRGGSDEDHREQESQTRLPRLLSVVNDKERATSRGCKGIQKVTIIGIHGWFSQGPLRNLFGEPTGTSVKFATMMSNAVKEHFMQAGQTLSDDQLSMIALEADGLVADRVNKSFSALLNNPKWLADILSANVVFIASHSQGSVVATHLLARLIEQRHLDPKRTRLVLLAMCGIHHGPFTHLRSSVASYYLNTFETPAAKELFEFQNSKSPVSMMYASALRIVINAGVKLVYIASMDDQVVPLYSALNSSASHPSILRAIFCDGAAFPRVDFLTNLLSFCAAVRNAGLSDHNLLTLLSASVAGSLYGGAGHSIVYEEPQVYTLAVRYLFEVTSPTAYPTTRQSDLKIPALHLEPFSTADNAKWNSNPFALPWSLRGLLEDEVVRRYFEPVIEKLLSDYNEWTPLTKTLKDVQFRLEPMRLVSRQPTPSPTTAPSTSKL